MKAALALLTVLTVLAVPAATSLAAAPVGSSIAALGDSITRGYDTCWVPYTDCTENSWSTGTSASVRSWYVRLLEGGAAISDHNYNDAETGARMADLRRQAESAVAQRASIVTILMGANDVCTSSVETMTPTATLRAQLRAALTTLTSGDPGAQIYAASIPNVYRLWEIFHSSWAADLVWSIAGICRSLLASPRSTAPDDVQRRQRVADQVVADNAAIAAVCKEFSNCHDDGGAAYDVAFTRSDVTARDFFHPSAAGQAKAAAAIWGAFAQ
jgi:lysophospholipase L1-like esterase